MVAAISDDLDEAKKQLEIGSEVSLRNIDGQSALDIAIKCGKDIGIWVELFALYKEQFDSKDLARYHEYRLSALFAKK